MADPNALYSHNGEEPQKLGHEIFWVEEWGQTVFRTGVESFTKEELTRAGYTGPYEIPEFNPEIERVEWDGEKLEYVVKYILDGDLWKRIREKRNRLLQESDKYFLSDIPGFGKYNLPEWEKYRNQLRDLTEEFDDPKKVVFPICPEDPSFTPTYPIVSEVPLRWRISDLEKVVKVLCEKNDVSWEELTGTLKSPTFIQES